MQTGVAMLGVRNPSDINEVGIPLTFILSPEPGGEGRVRGRGIRVSRMM